MPTVVELEGVPEMVAVGAVSLAVVVSEAANGFVVTSDPPHPTRAHETSTTKPVALISLNYTLLDFTYSGDGQADRPP